ncbi:MAG: hypothetical protein HYS09_10115 [Chloroflexi bacterium]|nr:hypothetical protein [Chloroflexota bacterium]
MKIMIYFVLSVVAIIGLIVLISAAVGLATYPEDEDPLGKIGYVVGIWMGAIGLGASVVGMLLTWLIGRFLARGKRGG